MNYLKLCRISSFNISIPRRKRQHQASKFGEGDPACARWHKQRPESSRHTEKSDTLGWWFSYQRDSKRQNAQNNSSEPIHKTDARSTRPC